VSYRRLGLRVSRRIDVRALLDSTAGAQSKPIAVASREGSLRAGVQFSDVGLALARFSRPIGHTGRDDKVSFVGVEHYFTRLLAYDAITTYVARVAPERSDELEQHVIRPFTADEFAYVAWYQSQADKAPFIRRAHAVHVRRRPPGRCLPARPRTTSVSSSWYLSIGIMPEGLGPLFPSRGGAWWCRRR
jgi:hypothetical protein